MLSSVLTVPLEALVDVDVVVIGSGTAGVTTALELARGGCKVAILEAGPLVVTQHVGSSPLRSRSDLVADLQARVSYQRRWGEVDVPLWSLAGGRTVLWGGCTPRFKPADFASWPFGYEEFAPYYSRAERLIRVSGAPGTLPPFCQGAEHERLMGVLRAEGVAVNYAPLAVDTGAPVAGHIPRGFDSSIARLVEYGPGVSLTVDARVTRLNVSEGRVASVQVGERVVPCRRVVLAAGAMASTELALRSSVGGSEAGHWIGDHLLAGGAWELSDPSPERPVYLLIDPSEDRPFQVQLEGPFARLDLHPYHTTSWLALPPEGRYLLGVCFGIASVSRENRMELQGSSYQVHYTRSSWDEQVLAAMPPFLERLAPLVGGRYLGCRAQPPGRALHEFGGLRMGSVVDEWGRFLDVENLWAADAAVFPFQGAANSYLSITAWALRCAEGILRC